MPQKLPVNNFKWGKVILKKEMQDIFFEVDVQYPEKLHALHNNLPYLSERWVIEKVKKLAAYLQDKIKMLYI